MLDKFAIASALREIALLLDLKRENPYKTRAYNIGAGAVESISEDLGRVIGEERLTQVRGIGHALAQKIEELYTTGHSKMLDKLRAEMPPGVIELSQVPGLSVKKIQMLHAELGIISLEELEQACNEGRVSGVKGFGKKTEANILQGIAKYRSREKSEILLDALDLANRLNHHLRHTRTITRVETAGEVRRWCEVVQHVDVVVETIHPGAAMEELAGFPLVTRMENEEDDHCSVRLADGMRVNLRCGTSETFPTALLFETGSAQHIERLQELADEQGYKLTVDGLKKGSRIIKVKNEAEIYAHLGLPFIPAELRENAGEIESALEGDTFDDLLRVEDIQGLTHCHTVYSDGKHTVEAMARAAQNLGMQYITVTDHSPAAHYAGGLNIDRLKEQWEEIDRAQEKLKIKILRGTESDILEDGSLDYPDSILEQFDIIIASVHSRMKMDEDEMTRRIIRCMKKRQFKIWGHALGRLLLRRDPFSVRMDEVLDVIAESKAAIEVNGDPYRLDMAPEYIREARKRGIKFVISVDAHSTGALNYVRFGVHMARRGGLRKSEVLNTLPLEKFRKAVHP